MTVTSLLFTDNFGTLFSTNGSTVSFVADSSSTPPFEGVNYYYYFAGTVVDSTAYLTFADSTNSTFAIWSYDGATVKQITSSSMSINVNPAPYNSLNPQPLTSFNSKLIFSQGPSAGHETLAVYDPTTQQITQPSVPNHGYDPHDFVQLSGVLYFEAYDVDNSSNYKDAIYSFDGTSVTEIYNLSPKDGDNNYSDGTAAGPLAVFNGHLYFGSPSGSVYELTSTASLSNSAAKVASGLAGSINVSSHFAVTSSHLFFAGNDSAGSGDIYSLDASNNVTLVEQGSGAIGFDPVVLNNTLYFSDQIHNNIYSSSGGSPTLVVSGQQLTGDVVVMNNIAYFTDGSDLKAFNGTSVSTILVPGDHGQNPLMVVPFLPTGWSTNSAPTNTDPTISHDTGATVLEGQSATVTTAELQATDAEQDAASLTYTITTAALHGTLKLNGTTSLGLNSTFTQADIDNGHISYVHDGSETTSDSFGFSVSDGAGGSVTGQTFDFTVTPVNDPPHGIDDTASATEAGGVANGTAGTDGTGNVLDNDTDPDTSHGSLTVSAFRTGAEAGSGTAGTLDSGLAGTYGTLTLGSNGTYTYVVDNSNADVQALNSSGTLTDTFTYTVFDGSLTDTAQLVVTIHGANDAPTGVNDTGDAYEGGGVANASGGSNATGDVRANDTDPDNLTSSLTVTALHTGHEADVGVAGTVGSGLGGDYGTLTLDSNGSYTYVVDDTNADVQALNSGVTLTDTFTYTISDGSLTDTAELTITVHGTDDAPTVNLGSPTLAYTENDTATAIAPAGTVADVDSSDFDGGSLTVSLTTNGATEDQLSILTDADVSVTSGVVSVDGHEVGTVSGGTNGSDLVVTFDSADATPAAVETLIQHIAYADSSENPSGLARTVTFSVADGDGATGTDTATIDVTPVNDPPVGVDDAADATEESGVGNTTVGLDATGNVLTNDTDVDNAGNTLVVSAFRTGTEIAGTGTDGTVNSALAGSYGSLTLHDDGSYSYTADDNNSDVQALNTGDTLTDTFTYTVEDPDGLTDTAQLVVTVHGADDAAVVSLGSPTLSYTENDTATAIAPAGGVTDVDSSDFNGGSLTVSLTTNGAPEDQLSILTDADVSVAAGVVSVDGHEVGSVSGGSNGSDLVVSFDSADATPTAIATLIEHIAYADSSDDPSGLARTVTFTVNDGDGYNGTDTATIDVTPVNDPPVFSGLDNTPSYFLRGPGVVLDGDATVSDPELDALNGGAGNYAGAVLTLERDGHASGADVFGTSGTLAFVGSDVQVGGTSVGSVTESGGILTISFNSNATTALVDGVLDQITYSNPSTGSPPTHVQVDYSLSDGNSGSQGTGDTPGIGTGSVTVDLHGVTIIGTDGADLVDLHHTPPGQLLPTGLDDTIYGRGGDDHLSGLAGNDHIIGGLGSDVINGDGGADTISGGAQNDVVHGGDGQDQIDGGSGSDQLYGDDGDDTITGGTGNDQISGGFGNDTLSGGDGTDTLNGGDGRDTLYGGADNDGLHGGNGADELHGGAGSDHLNGDDGNDHLLGDAGNDQLSGGLGNDVLSGGDGVDTLNGGDGGDTLYGGGDNDTLNGGNGNDELHGGDGTDDLKGGFGNDTIRGDDGNDQISGGFGDDTLDGGVGNDHISGGDGKDRITGGPGQDFMSGGAGNDTFVFNTLSDFSPSGSPPVDPTKFDQILDFQHGHDQVDLSALDASTAPGLQHFNFIGTATFGAAGDLRYDKIGASTVALYGDVDGDHVADFAVEFQHLSSLSVSDFILS